MAEKLYRNWIPTQGIEVYSREGFSPEKLTEMERAGAPLASVRDLAFARCLTGPDHLVSRTTSYVSAAVVHPVNDQHFYLVKAPHHPLFSSVGEIVTGGNGHRHYDIPPLAAHQSDALSAILDKACPDLDGALESGVLRVPRFDGTVLPIELDDYLSHVAIQFLFEDMTIPSHQFMKRMGVTGVRLTAYPLVPSAEGGAIARIFPLIMGAALDTDNRFYIHGETRLDPNQNHMHGIKHVDLLTVANRDGSKVLAFSALQQVDPAQFPADFVQQPGKYIIADGSLYVHVPSDGIVDLFRSSDTKTAK